MCMKCVNVFILLVLLAIKSYPQQEMIKGKVIDRFTSPIEYATVLLQSEGKSYQSVILTDSIGNFTFDKTYDRNYLLIIQHVAYITDSLRIGPGNKLTAPLVISEKSNVLTELMVTSERPLMKVENNTFIYNIQPLLQNNIILNAYEAVKEIPGIIELGGTLSLAGSENLKIVIDGQVTSLSLQQILGILKSTSSSRIEKVEVSYNAPARYNTHGALINVVLKADENKGHPFTGEIGGTYLQSYYPSVSQNIGLSYNKKKIRLDFSSNFNNGKGWNKSTAFTKQSIGDDLITIDEKIRNTNKYVGFNPRVGVNYRLDKDKKIQFSYYLETKKGDTDNRSDAIYKEQVEYEVQSTNKSKNNDYLNNIYIEYASEKINIGSDIIFYNNFTDRDFQTQRDNDEIQVLNNSSKQKISNYSVFFNHNINPFDNIKLTYGTNARYNKADTYVNYYYAKNSDFAEDEYFPIRGKQVEYLLNSYVEAEYRANSKFFMSSSMKMEYFHSTYNNNGIQSVLWNGWSFYPNATLTYTANADNNLQFTLSSNKRYPSFWAVNPQTTNLSSYTQIEGNPQLKPSKSYQGHLLYTYKHKYVFSVAFQYISDFFMQMPHMSEDRLKIIHRYENFDGFYRIRGMVVIPFRIDNYLNSRLTVQGFGTHEKINSFYGSSIDHIFLNGIVALHNSLKISSGFSLQVNADYHSPSRQGVYVLGSRWGLDSRLEWKMKTHLSLVLRYENILQHQIPRPLKVVYSNQYRWSRDYEKSTLGITVLWRFNQYKAERYKSPDNSRLEQ